MVCLFLVLVLVLVHELWPGFEDEDENDDEGDPSASPTFLTAPPGRGNTVLQRSARPHRAPPQPSQCQGCLLRPGITN